MALPYGTLRQRYMEPEGVSTRRLYESMAAELARTPERLRFYLLYGGTELGSERDRRRFGRMLYEGAFGRASFPGRFRAGTLRVRWLDVSKPFPRLHPAPQCVWLALERGRVEPARRELVERVVPRGLSSTCRFGDDP